MWSGEFGLLKARKTSGLIPTVKEGAVDLVSVVGCIGGRELRNP
jgi:hypothetical protein